MEKLKTPKAKLKEKKCILLFSKENVYPDADTPNNLYDGVKFSDLPLCYIRTSKNNTIINFRDASDGHIAYRSCGMDGFKNTRKGTNIAAQTTAVAIGGVNIKSIL